MTAGLPGIGLGGLFVVITALVMPIAARLRRRPLRQTRVLVTLGVASIVVGTAAIALTFKVLGVTVYETKLGAPVIVLT